MDLETCVFINTDKHSWIWGKVLNSTDVSVEVEHQAISDNGQEGGAKVRATHARELTHRYIEFDLNVDDLLSLPYLHDSVILNALRRKYFANSIYTYIGNILISINPYSFRHPHYDEAMRDTLLNRGDNVLTDGGPAHIWCRAQSVYWLLRSTGENQSVLVSGESGAGKTEAVKLILHHLAGCSTRAAGEGSKEISSYMAEHIEQCSPLMESFGNACTCLNNNSSRFGKFINIGFSKEGVMCNADITTYLLEKTRIVYHDTRETCYHVFYQLLCGESEEVLRSEYFLESDFNKYHMLRTQKDIDRAEYKAEFESLVASMACMKISKEEQKAIFKICAAIIHLQNIRFEKCDRKHVKFAQDTEVHLQAFCDLLQLKVDDVAHNLTHLVTDKFVRPHDKAQSELNRGAMSKFLYSRLFTFLVAKINLSLSQFKPSSGTSEGWIGLLDIFGFEVFKRNSFEQLCINLTNEKLQNHYNTCIFANELKEYKSEGLDITEMTYADNSNVLNLLEGPQGLFDRLDDESKQKGGTDSNLLIALGQLRNKAIQIAKQKTSEFTIKHYASDVTYTIEGFRNKNADPINENIIKCLLRSGLPLVPEICNVEVGKSTISAALRRSLNDLLKTISQTNVNWVRCLKPNSEKRECFFEGVNVLNQLKYSGIMETVQIRKHGYPIRFMFEEFCASQALFLKGVTGKRYPQLSTQQKCETLLEQSTWDTIGFPECYGSVRLGKSKIFLKEATYNSIISAATKLRQQHSSVIGAFAWQKLAGYVTAQRAFRRNIKTIQSFTLAYLAQIECLDRHARVAVVQAEAKHRLLIVQRNDVLFQRQCLEQAEDLERATARENERVAIATARENERLAIATARENERLAIATARENERVAIATAREHQRLALATSEETSAGDPQIQPLVTHDITLPTTPLPSNSLPSHNNIIPPTHNDSSPPPNTAQITPGLIKPHHPHTTVEATAHIFGQVNNSLDPLFSIGSFISDVSQFIPILVDILTS